MVISAVVELKSPRLAPSLDPIGKPLTWAHFLDGSPGTNSTGTDYPSRLRLLGSSRFWSVPGSDWTRFLSWVLGTNHRLLATDIRAPHWPGAVDDFRRYRESVAVHGPWKKYGKASSICSEASLSYYIQLTPLSGEAVYRRQRRVSGPSRRAEKGS